MNFSNGVLSLALIAFIILLAFLSCERASLDPQEEPPETSLDTTALIQKYFASPQECAQCHPNHFQEWLTSMHAYAMTDPVFFKLNAIAQQSDNLDQFCTKCHSPIAPVLGATPPGFDPGNLSTLVKSGIFCDACHKMDVETFDRGAGIKSFHLNRVRQGPIADPQPNPFHESQYVNDVSFSGFCSPCHDVQSPDKSFFIEKTSTEWDASPFSGMGVECQGCHMPLYSGQAAVGGPQRDNLHHHYFVGVDYPLIDFPGKDETIQRIRDLLQNAVNMIVSAPATVTPEQKFEISVRVANNLTGHNIPSGNIFDRQMWIEVLVKDAIYQTTYFASGMLDPNGDLLDDHSEYVSSGLMEADTALALFNGRPYDKNGDETLFFWRTQSADVTTIPAFQSRTADYQVTAPGQAAQLELSVRLRFRSFPPYLLREIGEEALINKLIVFDMETFQQTIAVGE